MTMDMSAYQAETAAWMNACFGEEVAADRTERIHRFLEEALELAQSLRCTPAEAHQLVDYVFSRPAGDPYQEVGGTLVTLAALCHANNIDLNAAGQVELSRVWTRMPQIRAKHRAKPKMSPLPGPSAP
jgi:hypothetical protein